jgi:transmembrane sensor
MSDSADSIEQQACAWIAKLNGEPSDGDLQQFRAWMAQSPAHRTQIRQLAKLWGQLDILAELAVINMPPTTLTSSLAVKLKALVHSTAQQLSKRPAQASLAFALVLAIALSTLFSLDRNSYSTAVGQQQLITLHDGSTVLLNTNSQISVDYSNQARNITLVKGQAHFDVMPNPNKPFNVYAGTGLVKALGTAFSVYLQPEILEVTVTEGTVELNALQPAAPQPADQASNRQVAEAKVTKLTLLDAGQNARIDQRNHSIDQLETVDAPAIMQKLAWHQGLLQFSGDPLQEVVAEISRYTDLNIVIADPQIRNLRIGGFFKVGETDKMLEALETSFGIDVKRLGNRTVHLTAASP